jgi:hypothetical protein
MKKMLAAIALAGSFLIASEAKAQVTVSTIPSRGTPGIVSTSNAGVSFPTQATRYFPYSYYAAAPFPAREYVGYGFNDFPFYGKPYGSPNDRWSWNTMSQSSYVSRGTFYGPVP